MGRQNATRTLSVLMLPVSTCVCVRAASLEMGRVAVSSVSYPILFYRPPGLSLYQPGLYSSHIIWLVMKYNKRYNLNAI